MLNFRCMRSLQITLNISSVDVASKIFIKLTLLRFSHYIFYHYRLLFILKLV